MRDGKKVHSKTRHFHSPALWFLVAGSVVAALVVGGYFLFRPATPLSSEITQDAASQERADMATKVLSGELSESDLEAAVNKAPSSADKAEVLQEYAAYILVQEGASEELLQQALNAAQRAYELDGQTGSLWLVSQAATKLGRSELAAEAQKTIDEKLSQEELHG